MRSRQEQPIFGSCAGCPRPKQSAAGAPRNRSARAHVRYSLPWPLAVARSIAPPRGRRRARAAMRGELRWCRLRDGRRIPFSAGAGAAAGPEGEGQRRHPEHVRIDVDAFLEPHPRRRQVRFQQGHVLGGQDSAHGRCDDRRQREQAEPPPVQEGPEDLSGVDSAPRMSMLKMPPVMAPTRIANRPSITAVKAQGALPPWGHPHARRQRQNQTAEAELREARAVERVEREAAAQRSANRSDAADGDAHRRRRRPGPAAGTRRVPRADARGSAT